VLAEAGAGPTEVAGQILAVPDPPDPWVAGWLDGAAADLAQQAPPLAVDLLRRTLDPLPVTAPGREANAAREANAEPEDSARRRRLAAQLARLLFRQGQSAEAEPYARFAAEAADRELAASMRWVLGYALARTGQAAEAAQVLGLALADPLLPQVWRARLLALAALFRSRVDGDVDAAEADSKAALAFAEATGDRYAIGCALHALATVHAVRRDEDRRLACIERALGVLGDDPEAADLRLLHLANRMYGLSVLDRLGEVRQTLAELRTLAEQVGDTSLASLHHPAAVHFLFAGEWDEALAELDAISDVPEDSAVLGMVHGLAALIAARRDQRAVATRHLEAVRDEWLDTPVARANSLPLFAARAVVAERGGSPADAVSALRPLLADEYRQAERHLLLPELVRLALGAGDVEMAGSATRTCLADAQERPLPSQRASAARCRGMLDGDPAPVLAAVAHYRAAGRIPDLGQALEEAAVLLARRGDTAAARAAFAETVEVYDRLGAAWDLRRADARIRPYGIRRGVRGPRRRPRYGWEALSPTERRIAQLIAQGQSNPDIAADLLMSRGTVQTHVSHILTKLGARSRIEVAREAVRQSEPG
jgi:DNA-binding CsgD family transcriptional regulator